MYSVQGLLKDSIPFSEVGIGPEMCTCCSWQSLSFSSSREKSSFRISEPVFLWRMSKDPLCLIMFISLVGNIFARSLMNVLSMVTFSVFATSTCLVGVKLAVCCWAYISQYALQSNQHWIYEGDGIMVEFLNHTMVIFTLGLLICHFDQKITI